MKTYILIALMAVALNTNAQITLAHTYDSASYNPAYCQLLIVKFEVSGERYVKINRQGSNISIYDLNHSLIKTIYPPSLSTSDNVLYLSEQLFNTDPKMEYMEANFSGTKIYNEDGTLLFSDSCTAEVWFTVPTQQYPIYNTSQGTEMILSCPNGQAKVFNLPGTLSNGIQEGNAQLMQAQGGALSNLYPNPSTGKVTLQYELPKGEKQGEIILYNTQGAEVKRYKVDDTFNDLLLDNTQLPAGTYFYQLVTSKGAVGNKKMVVVR